MKSVTGPQTEFILIGKPSCYAEMLTCDGNGYKGLDGDLPKGGKGRYTVLRLDLPSSELDRKGGREFRSNPLAYDELRSFWAESQT